MIRALLLSEWHFMRILRLGFGIFIAIQAVQNHDLFAGLIAAFFLYQAVTNTGCCGANGCAAGPAVQSKADQTENIVFEEVK